jgi:DNA-binding HxlR family transcriptional regulator
MRDKAATPRPLTLTQALKVLGDRWSLLIVRDMMFGKIHSFKELLETAEGIATNTLSNRLQKMLDYGLLTVERNPADRRKLTYSLTRKGLDLAPVLQEMARWTAKHFPNRDGKSRARTYPRPGRSSRTHVAQKHRT